MTIILLIIILATQITIFYKLKKIIMGAEAKIQEMIDAAVTIVTEAFNTNVGDLTEAEAEAKKQELIDRLNAVINPVTP